MLSIILGLGTTLLGCIGASQFWRHALESSDLAVVMSFISGIVAGCAGLGAGALLFALTEDV